MMKWTAGLLLATLLPAVAAAQGRGPTCKPAPRVFERSIETRLSESALPSSRPGPFYHATLEISFDAYMDQIVFTATPDDPASEGIFDIDFECAERGGTGPQVASTTALNCTVEKCGRTTCTLAPSDLRATTCGHPPITIDTLVELFKAMESGEVRVVAIGSSGLPIAALAGPCVEVDGLINPWGNCKP